MDSQDDELYPTFNGMSRKAMFAGAPLMPTITAFGCSVILGMAGMITIGAPGFILMFLFLPVFLWMKTMTENDDQAIDVMVLELKCLLFKSNTSIFAKSTTLVHTKIGRSINVYKSYFTNYQRH